MGKIKLHDKYFVPYIPYPQIDKAIEKIAKQINQDFSSSDEIPVFICVLNGSIIFTGELLKKIDFPCEISSLKLSSYEGTSSTGNVNELIGLTSDIKGRTVIVLEDIVDTGNTIEELQRLILEAGASKIKFCTMLLKPSVYKKDIKLDYVGLEVDNKFIVGFGLDYNQLGRNYKDIYLLE